MKFFKYIILIAGFSSLSLSCGNSRKDLPDYIVEEEKLVPLLVDIHLTDAMLSKEKKPHSEKYEKALKMYPSVLLKHNIDRAVFDSTIRYYVKNPERFAKIYDDVLRELSIMQGKVQETPGELDEEE